MVRGGDAQLFHDLRAQWVPAFALRNRDDSGRGIGHKPRNDGWENATVADDYQMPTGTLMKGKKGVITGVANHQSIAWGIASQLAAQGAELAFLHLPGMERRVQPLATSIGVKVLAPVDVRSEERRVG